MKNKFMAAVLAVTLAIVTVLPLQAQECRIIEEVLAVQLNHVPAATIHELNKVDVQVFTSYYNNMPPVSNVVFDRMVYLSHPANPDVIYLVASIAGCVAEAGQTSLEQLNRVIKGVEAQNN